MTAPSAKPTTFTQRGLPPRLLAGGALIVGAFLMTASHYARRPVASESRDWWLPVAATASAGLLAMVPLRRAAGGGLFSALRSREPDMPLSSIAGALLIGGVLIAWYDWSGANPDPQVSALLLAVMLAGVMVGVFVGFLFGIPRFDYGEETASPGPATTTARDISPPSGLIRTTSTSGSAASGALRRAKYRPSTNLDEIADWLTKIIVGLGLVHLGKIGPALDSLATRIATNCATPCPTHPFTASVIIYSVIGGLLFGYVWTRLYYAKLAARTDREVVRETMRDLEVESAETLGVGKTAAVSEAMPPSGMAPGADDPNKGQFDGSPIRNGRILRAVISPSAVDREFYRITLSVESTDLSRPLEGFVEFHLHPTFREPVIARPVENGVASLTALAYGAFTVGAVADGGRTRLELDLATHPDAPEDFRSR